jgi:HK97 family phage major capsid protein
MAAKVAELAPKPESNVQTEPVTLEIPTFAHWTEVSKQILDDVAELRAILDGILRGGLLDVVDADIYDVLTTGGNYTAFSPVGAVIGDNVARIAAQIANQGGSNIVVGLNPTDFLTMQLAKASTAGSYLGIPPNLASRVVSVAAVAQSKILAFAPFSGASWADREGVNVVAGLRNDQFTRNALSLLAECRGATLVRDPGHVAYGDVTA